MLRNERETLPLIKSDRIAVVTFGKSDDMTAKLNKEGYNVNDYLISGELSKVKKTRIINELKNYQLVVINIRNTSIYATKKCLS